MTHEGWTNYETWAVALWVDNDEGLYTERKRLVRRHDDDAGDCASALKEWITDMTPDMGATLWADLLQSALSEVNWHELAETWIAESKE
jgi:hypothetical protein